MGKAIVELSSIELQKLVNLLTQDEEENEEPSELYIYLTTELQKLSDDENNKKLDDFI